MRFPARATVGESPKPIVLSPSISPVCHERDTLGVVSPIGFIGDRRSFVKGISR